MNARLIITYKSPVIKPLDKWTSRDFIKYYFNSLQKFDGSNPIKIPAEAWIGFGSRIKGFKRKLAISNHQYKHFIDVVFENFFSKEGYQPVFGCIVSEKVYFLVQRVKSTTEFSNNEFEELREELYKDGSLFEKIKLRLTDD